MKLYTSVGPNPNAVRLFLAEKGVDIPIQKIDIRDGENRREPYLSTVNPRGQCPALELDNGSHVCEITAICEYLEEQYPEPVLIGSTAEQRAETRMWVRRIDLGICEPMGVAFRSSEGIEMFKDRIRTLPEAADGLKAVAQDNLGWINEQLADQPFICGERFSLADIILYAFTRFGANINQPINPRHSNLVAWFDRVAARDSNQK